MIPLKLELKNFLSYGPTLQTINFEPYHLICLNGKNGHGKSALLDAMTWAIWGQARKVSNTAKADAHLLRLGQTQMLVHFEFAFNGQRYRIRREYAKTYGKPHAVLDFGIIEKKDTIRPLTDKTIRKTQEKIIQIIGLDYDAFINSAFIRQGNANEFSKKPPKERKEILASILHLQLYEILRKQAQEKAKSYIQEKNTIQALQENINADLAQEKDIQNKHNDLDKRYKHLVQQEKITQTTQEKLAKEKIALQNKNQQYEMFKYQLDQITTQEHEEQKKVRSLFFTWRMINNKKKTYGNKELLEKQRYKIEQKIQADQKSLQKNLLLKEQYLQKKELQQNRIRQLQDQHTTKTHKKSLHIERIKLQLTQLEKQEKECIQKKDQAEESCRDLEKKQLELEKKSIGIKKIEHTIKEIEKIFEKRKLYYNNWLSQARILKQEQNAQIQKQTMVADEDNPACPLCEQNLSATRKRFLQKKFTKQASFYTHRLKRLTHILQTLKPLLVKQHAKLQEANKKREEIYILDTQIAEKLKERNNITQTIKECTNHQNTITAQKKELKKNLEEQQHGLEHEKKEINTVLKKDTQYQQLTQELEQLEKTIKNTTHNQDEYQKNCSQLKEIELKIKKYDTFMQELVLQKQRMKEIQQSCASLRSFKKQKHDLKKNVNEASHIEKELKKHVLKEQETIETLKLLHKEKELLLQEKGRLEQQLEKIKEQHKKTTEHKKRAKKLDDEIYSYNVISNAMSKDGIQALLIEEALPEIEHEANELLAQLTDNQTHIIIDSLRDLKKGGTKETLDIKISDPMGIRPYELFSGGESFRIDFALRIAISKLLARRAGTSLQTLIIDEGFGSQDEEGLTRLMDAIYKIQDNFNKVIIVSHLPSMKDQFPVHFYIEKDTHGSQVHIIENG